MADSPGSPPLSTVVPSDGSPREAFGRAEEAAAQGDWRSAAETLRGIASLNLPGAGHVSGLLAICLRQAAVEQANQAFRALDGAVRDRAARIDEIARAAAPADRGLRQSCAACGKGVAAASPPGIGAWKGLRFEGRGVALLCPSCAQGLVAAALPVPQADALVAAEATLAESAALDPDNTRIAAELSQLAALLDRLEVSRPARPAAMLEPQARTETVPPPAPAPMPPPDWRPIMSEDPDDKPRRAPTIVWLGIAALIVAAVALGTVQYARFAKIVRMLGDPAREVSQVDRAERQYMERLRRDPKAGYDPEFRRPSAVRQPPPAAPPAEAPKAQAAGESEFHTNFWLMVVVTTCVFAAAGMWLTRKKETGT